MPGLVPGIHVLGPASKTWMAGTSPAMTSGEFASLRRQLLRREAAVEGLVPRRHVFQQLWRGEARAVFGFKLVAELDEFSRAHEVDIGQRAAGERREAETEDRADIGLARIGDDVILHRARGF